METSEIKTKVYVSGFKGKKHTPETIEKMRLAKLGKKLSPEHVQSMSLASLGKKHTPETIEKMRLAMIGKDTKGPQHHASVVCEFRSPTNVVWYVKNISHFVRTHPELFNPEDVIMKRKEVYYCNALTGLLSLTKLKKPNGSWKGWTLVSKVEHYDNKGKDLLDRVLVEETDNALYPRK